MAFNLNILSQQDPRWKEKKLGFDVKATIGSDGCVLTCITMLVNGFGFNETPETLNQKLLDMGRGKGFVDDLIVWRSLSDAFPRIVYQNSIICRTLPAPLDMINKSLDSGYPLLVELGRSPRPGMESHWVILTSRQGEDYLMLDPWPFPVDSTPVSLSERYGFGQSPDQLITAVVWYQKIGVTFPLTVNPPRSGLIVCVQESLIGGLRLRSGPNTITSSLIALEPAGTQLCCLEPDEVVQAKIGSKDQWLQVKDPAGVSGFVAANYVHRLGISTPTPVPQVLVEQAPNATTAPANQVISEQVSEAIITPAAQSTRPAVLTVFVAQTVGSSGLRMRTDPDPLSSTVTVVQAGVELWVLEPADEALPKIGQQKQWLNVVEKNGNTGYLPAWFVELHPTNAPKPLESNQTRLTKPDEILIVTVSDLVNGGLHLRNKPDPCATSIRIIPVGSSLTVLETPATAYSKIGKQGEWLNVKETDGQSGFVSARYVQK
jgi:hypothetical protein